MPGRGGEVEAEQHAGRPAAQAAAGPPSAAGVLAAVLSVARRLALGLVLIAAASGALLLSDRRAGSRHGEQKRVLLIEYVNILDVEEAERGVRSGLREAGLAEGSDYLLTARNAQGDMAALNSMVDAAIAEDADLQITMSAPTLQAALRRGRGKPMVFTYVADPFAAGAGKSDRDHPVNVTGVYNRPAVTELLAALREVLPAAKVLSTLYAPAEVNSLYFHRQLEDEARRAGFEVRSTAINEANSASDAALAACQGGVDALCPVGGNLTAVTFPSIIQAANRARVPVFGFLTSQAEGGALLCVARDFYDGGREAGLMAARVLRGESPGAIPFEPVRKTRVIVNLNAARLCGVNLSPALIGRADQVIGR